MNLSIPDAATELAVSETRLRRTLLENAVPTSVEFRQTRTGVRKTTVLSPDTVEELRAHFAVPVPAALTAPPELQDFPREDAQAHDPAPCANDPSEYAIASARLCAESANVPYSPVSSAQSVPVGQFNALLYQHNVLREELSRVTEYLDGCDRLLGEMVRTIATLEERTRQLEPSDGRSRHAGNPLTGALRTVSAGVQNALFSRAAAKPMMKPAEVYYSNVLAGR